MIGGTKDPDLGAIAALRPTHVIVNEEENKPEHIAHLSARFSVLNTFPKDPGDVPMLLRSLAAFLGVEAVGASSALAADAALAECREGPRLIAIDRRCLYLIWRNPYMVAASNTYIDGMLKLAGLANAAAGRGERYPSLSVDEMRALAPDLLLLSSEPYPFRMRDAERLKGEWPDAPPMLKADGQLFSWYGTMAAGALRAVAKWRRGDEQSIITAFGGSGDPAKGDDFNRLS